jgi:hypothetical protein
MFPRVSLSGDTLNAGRGPSPGLWQNLPYPEIISDPARGYFFFDDFCGAGTLGPHGDNSAAAVTEKNGPYITFQSIVAGMAINDWSPSGLQTEHGGIVRLACDGDNEAAVLKQFMTPFMLKHSGIGKFAMEARIRIDNISDTQNDIFVGLVEQLVPTAAIPITATTPALADKNLVGFQRTGDNGDDIRTVYKADGQGTAGGTVVKDSALVPVADTWYKLGMLYDPSDNYLRFFVDGEELADTYLVTSTAGNPFPNDVPMGLCLAIVNAAAVTTYVDLDWWMAAQLL